MARRRRRRREDLRTSIRLPKDIAAALAQAERKAGWSHQAAVAFYVRAGLELIHGQGEAEPLRRMLFASIDQFRMETQAQAITREARAQLRAARRDVTERILTPVDLPIPPKPPEPPKKRGRPRKTPGILAAELAPRPGTGAPTADSAA